MRSLADRSVSVPMTLCDLDLATKSGMVTQVGELRVLGVSRAPIPRGRDLSAPIFLGLFQLTNYVETV